METLKFKTNINCGGCIAAVTPALNNLKGLEKWEVDTASPQKTLTVQMHNTQTTQQIVTVLHQKGFVAEQL